MKVSRWRTKGQDAGVQLAAHAGHRVAAFAADDDQRAARCEHRAQSGERCVSAGIDDGVVRAVGVLAGVVVSDDSFGAKRAHEVDLGGTRDAGHAGSQSHARSGRRSCRHHQMHQ